MKFKKFFKKLGRGALVTAKLASIIGIKGTVKSIPVVPFALEAIGAAEDLFGKGRGELKKDTAKLLIKGSIKAFESASKRELVDEDVLLEQLDPLIDALVKVANDLDLWERLLPNK